MGLIAQAKADIEQITSNLDEFGIEMTLTAPPPGNETATITGLHTKIELGVDTEGNMVNSRKVHVSFSEKFLIDAAYPLRNSAGEVDLKGHKIVVKDSTGLEKNYEFKQWFPNETIGLITCILEDFE